MKLLLGMNQNQNVTETSSPWYPEIDQTKLAWLEVSTTITYT